MYKFQELDVNKLEALETTLDVLSSVVDRDSFPIFYMVAFLDPRHTKEIQSLYLEELKSMADDDEEVKEPTVSTVVISTQLSSDTLYYLNGGGLLMDIEECALSIDGKIVEVSLNLRSLGRIKMNDLSKPALTDSEMAVEEYLSLSLKKTGSKKADVQNSRIVRVLDEAGNSWDESKESTAEMLERIKDSNKGNEFVSFAEGNLSKFFIEVKNGPEAAIRYIAEKTEMDYDEVKAAPSLVVMTWQEAVDFLQEIIDSDLDKTSSDDSSKPVKLTMYNAYATNLGTEYFDTVEEAHVAAKADRNEQDPGDFVVMYDISDSSTGLSEHWDWNPETDGWDKE